MKGKDVKIVLIVVLIVISVLVLMRVIKYSLIKKRGVTLTETPTNTDVTEQSESETDATIENDTPETTQPLQTIKEQFKTPLQS